MDETVDMCVCVCVYVCVCVCMSMHDTVESLHADADCLIGSDEYCNMSVVSFHVDSNKVGVGEWLQLGQV